MVDPDLAIAGVGHAAYDEMLLMAGGILLGIAIVGALSPLFLKRHRLIAIFSCLAAVVGIGCLIASARVCMIWDGGFSAAEIRLTFVDEDGNPVRGVELRVEDKLGRRFYHYPVTDYLPGQVPTSDEKGVMVFHHHTYFPLEFSSKICQCRFVPFAPATVEREFPSYRCSFLYKGRQVHDVSFRELDKWEGTWDTVPKVKREWTLSSWPAVQCRFKEPEGRDGPAALMADPFNFERDAGQTRTPESNAAERSARWAAEAYLEAQRQKDANLVEFPIVEKTVKITLRK